MCGCRRRQRRGLGKAVALLQGLPVVAMPTTFAGSEMTPVWGLTEAGHKRTGRDPRVLPRLVIYDVDLVAGLPHATAVTSALNAMAHAAEALYAPDGSPVVSLLAEEGARSLAAALDALGRDAADLAAWELALRGAWFSGSCLGATTMSLHHKICHVLGGTLGLPHSAVHAAVLPAVLAFNLPAAPRAAEALERALDDADPARRVWELGRTTTISPGLAGLGMRWEDCATVAAEVCAAPYANPRPVGLAAVTRIVEEAWAGSAPTGGCRLEAGRHR